MKAFILILLSFGYAQAQQKNPQIRVCNISGSYFQSLSVEQPKKDQVGFCGLQGAMIDSISLLQAMDGFDTMANRAFISSHNKVYQSCTQVNAIEILAKDRHSNLVHRFCLFNDGSYLSSLSLIEGWNSPLNKWLRNFLRDWIVE